MFSGIEAVETSEMSCGIDRDRLTQGFAAVTLAMSWPSMVMLPYSGTS